MKSMNDKTSEKTHVIRRPDQQSLKAIPLFSKGDLWGNGVEAEHQRGIQQPRARFLAFLISEIGS
jgi:hypothetical protein